MGLLVAAWPARGQEPEDHYLGILNLIEQADSFRTNSQTALALGKYRQAQIALRDFQKSYPTWNVKMVSYRSKYLAERVAALTSPTAPPAESDAPSGKAKAQVPGAIQLKLLGAGAEPRKVLRLHPKAGDKQRLVLTMKMAKDTKLGEMQTPTFKMPVMTLTMDAIVKAVSAEGDISYETLISDAAVAEDPDVLPQVAELVKSAMGSVKGLSGTGTTSNRGLHKSTDIKLPADAPPQTRQAMVQMKEAFAHVTLPLPEEAIGPGAKWEVKMPLESQGMKINQVATYELVSVEGDLLTVKSTVTQNASNQKVQSPVMPALKLDLKKMAGTGNAEVKVDLAQLMVSQGTIDSHTELSMEMDAGGQRQPVTDKTDLNVRVEAK